MEFLDWTFPPSDTPNDTPGVRLGVSYLRTLKDSISISIRLDDSSTLDLEISQVSMGPMAISSVVWDAGLYLVDFLESNAHIDLVDRIELGKTLELGTGTGICGITAACLGASTLLLSDIEEPAVLQSNIDELPAKFKDNIRFAAYDWSDSNVPDDFINVPEGWDTVLCRYIGYIGYIWYIWYIWYIGYIGCIGVYRVYRVYKGI